MAIPHQKLSNYSKCSMADEEGKYSLLTRTGEAVVQRLIQSNRKSSLASTGPLGKPAPQQSQIISDCYQICLGLVADNLHGSPDAPVSDEASRLILDTLLILQDKRPPPREQLCLGQFFGLSCGKQVTRIRKPWAKHLHNLDVTVRLRHPTGSYVVTAISMFPGIRLNNHPRLCDEHEEIMNGMLKTVLLAQAFRHLVIDTSGPGCRRDRSWNKSAFINPNQDTEVITAFVDHSFNFLISKHISHIFI